MNSCIFCLEGGDIVHNVKCRCNFCFHLACYEKYDRKTLCPMCRATVGELYVPPQPQPESVQTTVQIEDFSAQHGQNRSMQIVYAVCLIVCILLLIVGVWIMMET